jgi:hypothetical protein
MRIDTKMKKQPSKEKDARAVVVERKGGGGVGGKERERERGGVTRGGPRETQLCE